MIDEAEIRQKVLADLFEFDAAADVENASSAPDYQDVQGNFFTRSDAPADMMTEEGFRSNVNSQIRTTQIMCEVIAEKIKEMETIQRQNQAKIAQLCNTVGVKGAKF